MRYIIIVFSIFCIFGCGEREPQKISVQINTMFSQKNINVGQSIIGVFQRPEGSWISYSSTNDRFSGTYEKLPLSHPVGSASIDGIKLTVWWDKAGPFSEINPRGYDGECGQVFVINQKGCPIKINSINIRDLYE
jgi:hypothetical protein